MREFETEVYGIRYFVQYTTDELIPEVVIARLNNADESIAPIPDTHPHFDRIWNRCLIRSVEEKIDLDREGYHGNDY